jgi:hypothetical protein
MMAANNISGGFVHQSAVHIDIALVVVDDE